MQTLLSSKSGLSQLLYIPDILDEKECDIIKEILILQKFDENSVLPFLLYHPPIKIYGKVAHQQRSVGFFTDDIRVKGYRYSGQIMKSQRMTELMKNIIHRVNTKLGPQSIFNAILMNHYTNGMEYISAHSDSSYGLQNNIVASISVGANRTFRIRDKVTKDIVLDTPTFEKGLLIMSGRFQEEYTHEIIREKYILEPRWSLTFRTHIK